MLAVSLILALLPPLVLLLVWDRLADRWRERQRRRAKIQGFPVKLMPKPNDPAPPT